MQNAERDIEDFVPGFHSCECSFSKYKKIGDLIIFDTSLRAIDDRYSYDWGIICHDDVALGEFCVSPVRGSFSQWSRFGIMKHISFEDKI